MDQTNDIYQHLAIGIWTIIVVFIIYIALTGDWSSLTTITPAEY